MTDHSDLFEMRRLEMLSNTIFGVAMTLLAYDLPRASQVRCTAKLGRTAPPRITHRLIALMLSFIIAGMFWFSHHRRLAHSPYGTRGTVLLNLLFLMFIIILPATNSLNGAFDDSSVVAVVFGTHLIAIGTLNAWLWLRAVGWRIQPDVVAASTAVVIFVCATMVAMVAPSAAKYVWLPAFGAPVPASLLARRGRRASR